MIIFIAIWLIVGLAYIIRAMAMDYDNNTWSLDCFKSTIPSDIKSWGEMVLGVLLGPVFLVAELYVKICRRFTCDPNKFT